MNLKAAVFVLLLATALSSSCSKQETPRPIQIREADVLIQNQTKMDWTGVEIWVNDFYRSLAPSLAAGQVLRVPYSALVESYGRRFDTQHRAVYGVVVTARASDGSPVRFTFGKVRRR